MKKLLIIFVVVCLSCGCASIKQGVRKTVDTIVWFKDLWPDKPKDPEPDPPDVDPAKYYAHIWSKPEGEHSGKLVTGVDRSYKDEVTADSLVLHSEALGEIRGQYGGLYEDLEPAWRYPEPGKHYGQGHYELILINGHFQRWPESGTWYIGDKHDYWPPGIPRPW